MCKENEHEYQVGDKDYTGSGRVQLVLFCKKCGHTIKEIK